MRQQLKTLAVALTAKAAWAWYFWSNGNGEPVGLHQGRFIFDTHSYLGSIESLLAGNGYDPDLRMPGYGAVYLLLRLLMDRPVAIATLLGLQVLLGAIAVLSLAAIAKRTSGSGTVHWMVFWIAALVPMASEYDMQLLTESFTVASMVFAVHALLVHVQDGGWRSLLGCGLFTCWCVFLRPACGLMIPLFAWVLAHHHRGSFRTAARNLVLFALPFTVAESLWIVRNWRVHHAFHPLTNGFYERETEHQPFFPVMRLVMAYGGYYVWWDPKADIQWFIGREWRDGTMATVSPDDPRVPDGIMNKAFDRDSLELIARDYHRAWHGNEAPAVRDSLYAEVARRCDAYRVALEHEKPWQFHVASRMRLLKKFLWHSGTETIFPRSFAEMGIIGKVAKLFLSGLFVTVVVGGFVLSLLWPVRAREPLELLLPLLVIAGVLIYPWGFRLTEYRYLVPVFPFALVLTCRASALLLSRWWPGALR